MATKYNSFACLLAVLLLFGCSQSDDQAGTSGSDGSDTAQVATPAPVAGADNVDSPAAEEPSSGLPVADASELTEGLDHADLVEALNETQSAYEKEPASADAILNYAWVVEQAGMIQEEEGNDQAAAKAFRAAYNIIQKANADEVELPLHHSVGYINLNMARQQSKDGEAEAACASIAAAYDNGFPYILKILNDESLAAAREHSAFKAWAAEIKEQEMEHAREELANAESFPMDFDLVSVDGKPIKLADYHGKVCIADIWGTWCPPCREEIPAFVALQNKLGADGFQMLGFNHEGGEPEEDAETVRTFMAANEMNYPCSLINDEFLAQVPDFGGFPTTIFIDRHGKVRLKAVGFHNYYFLESVVDVLLAEEGPATATPEASTSTESD